MDCIPYINDLKIEIDMLKDSLSNCRDEKKYQNIVRIIEIKEKLMQTYKDNLSKLSDNQICYRIYLKILNGLKPSKAISEVAEENYIAGKKPTSEIAIYKYYYPKLKKIMNV